MIQIRNVPDDLHRKLKSRAALAGLSLSGYLLRQLQATADRPTGEELRARLHTREKITPTISSADIIREYRDRE